VLEPEEQRIVDDIRDHGWHVIGVDADDEGPGFAYSVGMTDTLNHPEVIVFGLDTRSMTSIVNGIGAEIRGGRRFDQPGVYADVLGGGVACKFVTVDPAHHPEYLGGAMWHRRHVGQPKTLRAVQCLWPDKAGTFPDDPACHPEVLRRQPLLE